MKFAQNNHPTRLFGPTLLFGTWEYGRPMKPLFIKTLNFWAWAEKMGRNDFLLNNNKRIYPFIREQSKSIWVIQGLFKTKIFVYVIVQFRWTNTVKQKICEDWICFLAQGQHSFLFIFMCSTPITSVNDDAWPDNNSFACFMARLHSG